MRPYDLQPQLEPCFGLADAGYCASTEGPGQPGLVQTALLAAFDDALRARQPRRQPGADASCVQAQAPRAGFSQACGSFPGAARSLSAGAAAPGGPCLARCRVLPPYAARVDGRVATVPRLPTAECSIKDRARAASRLQAATRGWQVRGRLHYTHLGPLLGPLFGVRALLGAQLAVGPLIGGQLRLGPPTNPTWAPQVSDEHLGAQVYPQLGGPN